MSCKVHSANEHSVHSLSFSLSKLRALIACINFNLTFASASLMQPLSTALIFCLHILRSTNKLVFLHPSKRVMQGMAKLIQIYFHHHPWGFKIQPWLNALLITFHISPSFPLALWIHILPCIHEFDNDSHEHKTSLFFAISRRWTGENEKISINWHKTPQSSSHSQIKYLLEPTLSLRKQSISITFIWVLLLLLPRLFSYFLFSLLALLNRSAGQEIFISIEPWTFYGKWTDNLRVL